MNLVRILGCSGAIAAGHRTTSFLLGDKLLVDAGTGVGDLSLDELLAIDHVLLTHSHLDHVAALPLLADSVMRLRCAQGRAPIRVYGLPQTLQALKDHLFNGVIWPDFCALPHPSAPVLALQPLLTGELLTLESWTVEALPAEHTVPAVGYAVWPGKPEQQACWVFTGDTGPNPLLWQALARYRVAQLIIETAFSDGDEAIARASRHLHPRALAHELQHFTSPADVYITHAKPADAADIAAELNRARLPHRIHFLKTGQQMPLGAPLGND